MGMLYLRVVSSQMENNMAHAEKRGDLFNDGRIRVHTNHCGEVFVDDVQNGVQMRISQSSRGLGFTTFGGGRVQPTVVAGSIGYEVVPR